MAQQGPIDGISSVWETDLQTADKQGQMSNDDFAGRLGL